MGRHTLQDSLCWYLSGASSTDAPQSTHAASLGAYRGDEFQVLTVTRTSPLVGIKVILVSGSNGPGLGTLRGLDSGKLAWTAPGDDEGAATTVANGTVEILASDDTDKWILVERTDNVIAVGPETIQLSEQIENAIGGGSFSGDEQDDGASHYRAVFFRNESDVAITDVAIWLDADYDTGLTVALEEPTTGALTDKTGAGESSEPSGLSWDSGTTSSTGLTLATLAAGGEYGLWIRHTVAAHATPSPGHLSVINYQYVAGGETYTGSLRGVWRIADDSLVGDVYWFATDEDVDLDSEPSPFAGGYPYVMEGGPPADPLEPGHYYSMAFGKRNAYGLIGKPSEPTTITIDASGNVLGGKPSPASVVNASPATSGKVRISALYMPTQTDQADAWEVYYTTDGTDPDIAVDTPSEVAMTLSARVNTLSFDTEELLEDTPVRAIVTTARTASDETTVFESDPSEVVSADVVWYGPKRVYGQVTDTMRFGVPQASCAPATTTLYIDEANNVRWVYSGAGSQLWADDVLVWNIVADETGRQDLGVHTPFVLRPGQAVSGASSDGTEPIEVAEWSAQKTLYVCVNGVRRVKLDVTAKQIHVPSFQPGGTLYETRATLPAWPKYASTCFQSWGRYAENWMTAMSVDTDGVLSLKPTCPWRVHATEEECY